jgi:cell wall-associated NlpC family hydrolase
MMHPDVDLEKFVLYFSSQVQMNLTDRIIDATISRTIDASSELKVTVNDYDRAVLNSGWLSNRLDVQIENLWFRLKGLEKQGDNLVLNFEDREIAVLRTYSKWKIADRRRVTRAEFVLSMIREVKEFVIPVVIPELHTIQPVQQYSDDPLGMDVVYNKKKALLKPKTTIAPPKSTPKNNNVVGVTKFHLTVQGDVATAEQIQNANIIIAVGESMIPAGAQHRRKMIVCAIMTAIVESWLKNLDHGTGTSLGLFQQIDQYWGSAADRMNPETASHNFYNHIIAADKKYPNHTYGELCQDVQGSNYPDRYEKWKSEGDAFVTAYGLTGGDNELAAAPINGQQPKVGKNKQGDYYYWRGTIYDRNSMKFRKPENSWSCIQRLAQEVNWKAFFVSGTFYFLSEDDMLKQAPLSMLTEFQDGITSMDGDYDNQKKSATLTIGARVGKWAVPPGSLVTVEQMGPWNGRWIISDYERNLFDLNATITLTKDSPALPEPYGGNQNQLLQGWFPHPATSTNAGTAIAPSPQFGGIPGANDGTRNSVVQIAMKAVELNKTYPWKYPPDEGGNGSRPARPMADSLWSVNAHASTDCSAFVTLVYKEAGCPDPNGPKYNYNGQGYTGTLVQQGIPVVTPSPGDLVFMHGTAIVPGHVALYVGNGKVAECGSDAGVVLSQWNWAPPVAIRSYLS